MDEETLLNSTVQVFDVEVVKYFMTRPETTSQKVYDDLTRIIARVGALYVPVRELPAVQKLLAGGEI